MKRTNKQIIEDLKAENFNLYVDLESKDLLITELIDLLKESIHKFENTQDYEIFDKLIQTLQKD